MRKDPILKENEPVRFSPHITPIKRRSHIRITRSTFLLPHRKTTVA
ncbi:hypothetical protein [Leptospira stimsonii]|nr:hypothetical protein [Leptospira stimsonii]